ncbi:MAG: M23 family metallopeptidase [Actinobacteria bacterium]|nr:M23 family metallopeptidase [Actinomycetota bacterium]
MNPPALLALVLALASAPNNQAALGPRVTLADPGAPGVGAYSLPVPDSLVTERALGAPHHDYPATDLMVPSGTPVFAVTAGVAITHTGERCGLGVTVAGDDRRRYVSCHLSVVSVPDRVRVSAGDVLGLSGDTGNARGVPHLHLHVLDPRGEYVCPQPAALDLFRGRQPPAAAWRVTTGCFFARAGTG